MLTICVGPNGSGKSLWAMHQVEEALVKDYRTIVTNLSIDLASLNVYMRKKYGDSVPSVFDRIVQIGKEETRTFWRYRTNVLDDYLYTPLSRGPFGDSSWDIPDRGCLFILDEIQTVFGARDWQRTGPEFVAYQTQHRKFSDDVIAIAPSSTLIEKQFRILSAECVVLENLYKLKVGLLKAPRRIVYNVFRNCPPVPGEEPMSKGSIYIDAGGLAGCYNTAAGLGVVGGRADIGRESKGIPWYWVFPAFLGVAALAWLFIVGTINHTQKWALSKVKVTAPKAAETNSAPAQAVSPFTGIPVRHEMPSPASARVSAPVVLAAAAPAVDLVECYGDGRAGELVVLDTAAGAVYGSKLQKHGLTWTLDGQQFRKAARPKVH